MIDNADDVARQLATSISERLPDALNQIIQRLPSGDVAGLRFDCNLSLGHPTSAGQELPVQVFSIDLATLIPSLTATARNSNANNQLVPALFERPTLPPLEPVEPVPTPDVETRNFRPRSTLVSPVITPQEHDDYPSKARKATGGLRVRVAANAESASLSLIHI